MPAVLLAEFADAIARRSAEIAAAVARNRPQGQAPMLLPIEGGAPPRVEAPPSATAADPLEIPTFLQRKVR